MSLSVFALFLCQTALASDLSVDIKANGEDGPIVVSPGTPVSITVSLTPLSTPGQIADWWVVALTPFDPPKEWYSYVYSTGWVPGINLCVQAPIFELSPPFEVLHAALPLGDYTFYFALDNNADGIPNATWLDGVEVHVQPGLIPPGLISPQEGEVLDNGCYDFSDPAEWSFDWSDVQSAAKYNIYVIGPNSTNPLIDNIVTSSSYFFSSSYVSEANRFGWTWKVRSGDNNNPANWSAWSETRHFDVEPVDTDCP